MVRHPSSPAASPPRPADRRAGLAGAQSDRSVRSVRFVRVFGALLALGCTIAAALALHDPARHRADPPGARRPTASLSPLPAPRSSLLAPSPAALPAPDDVVARAEQRAAAEPERAREFAYEAIAALHRAGHSADAAAFALHSSLGPRRDLVIAAYFEWAHRAPEAALTHAFTVADPDAREFAVQATLSGWARTDPAGLAQAAAAFPSGAEQSAALTKALRYWSQRDPDAAASWLAAHDQALPAAERALRED